MQTTAKNEKPNYLLDTLPFMVKDRLLPHLELVFLSAGITLHETNEKIKHVYFPLTAVVALSYVVENGACSELCLIGHEGIVGGGVLMGADATPHRANVLSAGYAYKISSQAIKEEFNRFQEFMRLLLRYTQSLMNQIAQTAICNQHHTIDQQLRRLLLLMLDRVSDNQLVMTQELISNTLGVRREGITEAAGKLQRAGIIAYRRGHITVIDRSQLEADCCECYNVVIRESHRLQPCLEVAKPYITSFTFN